MSSGFAVSNSHAASPLTVLSNFVAGSRPRIEYCRFPLYPDFVLKVTELSVPEPETSVGAWNFTGWIATGIFTTWPWSPVRTLEPLEYVLGGAVVRRNVTVHGVAVPGAAFFFDATGATER